MGYKIPSLAKLTEQFEKMPGIGKKSAQRLAFHVLSLSDEEAQQFADSIIDAKKHIHCCCVRHLLRPRARSQYHMCG